MGVTHMNTYDYKYCTYRSTNIFTHLYVFIIIIEGVIIVKP